MAAPSSWSGTLPTTVYSKLWTHTPHFIMFIAATVASSSQALTLTSDSSFRSSPSTSTSSLTVTNPSVLMTSAGHTAASDGNEPTESNISSTISEEERRRFLDSLQEGTMRNLIPTVFFLVILSVVGLLGNTMVLLVYSKKARRSATDIFIMMMAAGDMVCNGLVIPGEIYDLFYFWDLATPLLCKCRVYFNALTTLISAQLLVAIAVSRFRMICRPFETQISMEMAKKICVVVAFISVVSSIPNATLYGPQTRTLKAGISSRQCFTDDKYVHTIWPLVYTAYLTLFFFACCIPLVVLYIRIGLQAWRHSARHGISTAQNTPVASVNTASDTLDSMDDTDRKTKVWRFFRPKNKKKMDIAPKNSSDDEDLGKEKPLTITGKPTNVKEERLNCRKEDKTVDEVDDHCTNTIASPMKVQSPADSSMVELLTLKLLNDTDINTYEKRDGRLEAGKLKAEALNERTSPQEYPNGQDESQKPQDGAQNNRKEMTDDKRVDGHCLSENRKTKEKHDVVDDRTLKNNTSQSGTVTCHKSLQQKVDDTLTGESEAKQNNTGGSEMENPPQKEMTIGAYCGTNPKRTYLTVPETDEDVENQKKTKSCGGKSPMNGTLDSKSGNIKTSAQRRGLTRTTLMLCIISAVYIIGFVPYLMLMVCKFTVPNFQNNMSTAGFAVYHVFLRFYFINSAANAVIYSLCDIRFRNDAKKIMRCKT